MKNRKELPRFGYLKNYNVNVDRIVSHLREKNLLDWNVYNDIKVSANSKHRDFVVSNEFCKDNFFIEEGAEMMEGEYYRQLYLTDFDESKRGSPVELQRTNIFKRTKRLDPTRLEYLPEADELNYGVRNHHVEGPLAEVLDMFKGKITRVRLAFLKDRFDIKPHVDYDPTYVVRFHIPLITNPEVRCFMQRGENEVGVHLPADGKVYFFNSGLKHWVKNDSDEWRLHLIVDVHGQHDLDNLEELVF